MVVAGCGIFLNGKGSLWIFVRFFWVVVMRCGSFVGGSRWLLVVMGQSESSIGGSGR